MHLRPTVFLIISVTVAVGMLGLLLLVATAPIPERLRQIEGQVDYLKTAVAAVGTGIDARVSANRHAELDAYLTEIDGALLNGTEAALRELNLAYESGDVFTPIRWAGIHLLNWQDAEPHSPSERYAATTLGTNIATNVEHVTDTLTAHRSDAAQFAALKADFSKSLNQLLARLRQSGNGTDADAIYVTGGKLEASFARAGSAADLTHELIGNLEEKVKDIPRGSREQLDLLIKHAYTLNGLQGSMSELALQMNLSDLNVQLDTMAGLVANDRTYAASAVKDARILLNVCTLLLVGLLIVAGRRLQASYKALNASHDDLEQRVEERTKDLAQANDDLKESQVQLVQAEKMSSLGQLVAGVMHEINTPLLYVQNNTSMTAEWMDDFAQFARIALPLLSANGDVEVKRALDEMTTLRGEVDPDELSESISEFRSLAKDSLEGLNQISELVQSLKDFSRLDRASDDKFDVRSGIEKTLVITRNLLKGGIEVKQDFQEVPEIYCSPSRLNQVFINLVTNAAQAMDGKGELHISTRWIKNETEGDSVEIVFEDTGCGIPEDHLEKVMDPFFTTKPVGKGTGLGLSIVRQIVDQHEGQILIDSKEGQGTRIALSFPVRPSYLDTKDNAEEAA